MSTLLILLLLLGGSYSAIALFLWLGAKWAKTPPVSLLRAFGATLAIGLLSLLIHLGLMPLWSVVAVAPLLAGAIGVGVSLLVTWLALRSLFRTSFWRAIACWLPTLVPATAVIALIYLVLSPYVLAAYVQTAHAMAPTLLGRHQRGPCPHCGQSATVSFIPGVNTPDEMNRLGMCLSCQQSGIVVNVAPTVHAPDRFLANKLLTPRRWDLVVFRSLHDPSVRYVDRLIGFPGEEIVIKEGGVWINRVKQQNPYDIAKLSFSSGRKDIGEDLGSPERPMKLGPGEYFVIGDFSLRSADSRTWGALPAENIESVVSVIYWPPSRWRLIR